MFTCTQHDGEEKTIPMHANVNAPNTCNSNKQLDCMTQTKLCMGRATLHVHARVRAQELVCHDDVIALTSARAAKIMAAMDEVSVRVDDEFDDGQEGEEQYLHL